MKTIMLTQNKVALVDDEDFYRLAGHKWRALKDSRSKEYRAVRSLKRTRNGRKTEYMAREVIGYIPEGMVVDHINHDTLDNRKSNLRVVSHAENMRNRKKSRPMTSKFKGVYLHKASGKWLARVTYNGSVQYLGLFDCEKDAAHAYDVAARTSHKEFGLGNAYSN